MTHAPETTVATTPDVDPTLVEQRRRPLFISSALTSVLMLVMLGLGIGIAVGNHGLRDAHKGIAYLLIVVSIIATVLAHRYGRAKANLGTFFHALSLPILLLVQFVIGEGDFAMIHMVLGVLILIATVALTTLSSRRAKV
ncbi:hypothetical protein [Aestuariimicrobium sp. Y1814]|uniref:hypothetical protein n=1 Tax=Aestuariimicrobium sp. Y1814 TaxID=3418742 RepID=UPI003DA7A031